jgi:hypothetical protein
MGRHKNGAGLGKAPVRGPIPAFTARIVVARHDHPHKLKMVLSKRIKGDRHDPLKDTESSPVQDASRVANVTAAIPAATHDAHTARMELRNVEPDHR